MLMRDSGTKSLTIAISTALTEAFDFTKHSLLIVHMPSAWTAASIGFQVCSSRGGTFAILYDDDGNLVQIDSPAVSKAYTAPAELAGARWVKLFSQNGSGTATNQAAARALVVDFKG